MWNSTLFVNYFAFYACISVFLCIIFVFSQLQMVLATKKKAYRQVCPYANLYCCWFRIPLYWRERHYRSGLVLEASPKWLLACLFPALHPLSCVLKSRTICGLAARIAHRISSTPMRAYVCWVQNSIVVAIHFREDAAFRDRQRRTPPLGIMPERKSYREAIYSFTNLKL